MDSCFDKLLIYFIFQRQVFYDSIEEMLTKLDEFGGLVDMVRSCIVVVTWIRNISPWA